MMRNFIIMNVTYHSSDSYCPVLGTSIVSLLENNKSFDSIRIFVIEEKISEKNKDKLKTMVDSYGREIVFIPMPDVNKTQNLGLKAVRSGWIFNSYCRLYLDQILPDDVDRVLYLDSDVLVLGDLQELWNIDLQGKCVAGVTDCLSSKYYEMLEMSRTSHYCNSGVQLQDLRQWKEQKVGDKVRAYVHKSGGYIFFMEQTVFNVVLQDKILVLPPEYNTYTLMQCLSYRELIKLRNPRNYYSESEIQDAVKAPKIVHLTSTFIIKNRAWFADNNHPMKETFKKYKGMTPWRDEPGFPDRTNRLQKFERVCVKVVPHSILLGLVGWIYNGPRIINIKNKMRKARAKSQAGAETVKI